MKSIISRYGEMTSNPSKLVDNEGEEMSLNRVDKALLTVGITLQNTSGEFREFDEVIMELAEKWNTIDKNTLRYIATIMAGNRQQSRFLALVSSYDRLKELSAEAANSEDAAQLQYLKTLDSVDAKTQLLLTSLLSLYVESGIQNLYKTLLDAGKGIVDTFNLMPKLFNFPIIAIGKFGAAFWGVARIVTAVTKHIRTELLVLQKTTENLLTIVTLQEENKRLLIQLNSNQTLIENAQNTTRILTEEERKRAQAAIDENNRKIAVLLGTNNTLNGQNNAGLSWRARLGDSIGKAFSQEGRYMGLTMLGLGLSTIGSTWASNSLKQSAGAWLGSGMSILGSTLTGVAMLGAINPILGGIVGAVTGLILILPNVIVSEEERIKQLQEEAEEAKNTYILKKSDTQNLATQIEQLRKLEKARYDSKEAEEEYYLTANLMAETYPGLIDSITTTGDAIINLTSAELLLAAVRNESFKAAIDSAKKEIRLAEEKEKESKNQPGGQSSNTTLKAGSFVSNHAALLENLVYSGYRMFSQNKELTTVQDFERAYKEIYKGDSLIASERLVDIEQLKEYLNFIQENPSKIYLPEGFNAAEVMAAIGPLVKQQGLVELAKSETILTKRSNLNRTAASYFLGSNDSFVSEIPLIMSIISAQLELDIEKHFGKSLENISFDEFDSYFNEDNIRALLSMYLTNWNSFWNNLTEERKNDFITLLKQTSVMSQTQFEALLRDLFNLTEEAYNSIIETSYKDTYNIEDFKAKYASQEDDILQLVSRAADRWMGSLGESELLAINSFYDDLQNMADAGKITQSKQYVTLQRYLAVGQAISKLNDEEMEAIWYNWDGTLTGLYEIQEKLTELGFEDKNESINELIETLSVNVATEFNSFTSQISSNLEDFEKALSSAAKGMDYKAASELAVKMNKSLSDFKFIDGKYFFKNADDIRSAYIKYNEELLSLLTDRILLHAKSSGITGVENVNTLLSQLDVLKANEDNKELVAELESYRDFINISNQYVEYQVNAWKILNSSLKEVLKNIDKSLRDEQVDALVLQAMNSDFSGFMSNKYLVPYISIISNTIKNITSEVFSAATESIKAGHKVNIAVTDANREILDELSEQGFVDYNNELSTALIQVTKDNIDGYIKFIGTKVKNPTELAQYIQQAWNAIYDTNVIDAFTEFTSSTTVTRETADKFVIALGGTAEHTTDLMKLWGYKLNEATGDFEATTNSIEELLKKFDNLENGSIEQRNKIQALIDKLGALQQLDLSSALKNVISNYQSVTIEWREALANALGEDYDKISKFFNDSNGDGTYKFDIAGLQDYLNNSEIVVSDATYNLLQELIGNVVDDYLGSITKAIGYATSGTTNYTDVRKFLSDYEVDGWNFEWNNILGAWMLSGNDLIAYINLKAQELKLQNPNLSNNEIDSWINTQYNNIRDALDITSYLSAEDRGENSKAREALRLQIENIKALSGEFTEKTTEEIINDLEAGGERAVETLKKLKPNASSEEIQNAYRVVVNDLLNALEAIGSLTTDQIISTNGALYEALSQLDMVDNNGVIKDTFNMVAAYTKIYENMKETAGKTQSDLNKAYADVLTAGEQKEIDAIEAMSNAMGMTYYQLGEILGKLGKDLEDFMKNRAASLGVEQIGNGQVRLNDFNAFAKEMGWEYGSEEYLSAFKAYNDSLVELNHQTEKSILDEVKNVISAGRGDKVNLTYLMSVLGTGAEEILNELLDKYGASIKNGILTISEGADLIGISLTIQNAAENSGKLMEEELAEIADSITEAINNYSELLIKGITGNLTNVDLLKLMKDSGLLSVTYEKTADGLRLTQEYLIRLYSAMDAGVNKIKVFNELNKYLQENNEHYKTAGANLARISELNKLRAEEAEKLLDTSSAISKADKQVSLNRLKQYSQELAVAEKIAAVRATTEDSSYNFMDQEMPGGFQNPINYWESWGNAMKSIQEAGENGYIGIQDYYNMITHIQDLAVLTGKDMKFMGMTISLDGTSAAELIERGFKAMTLDVESGNTVLSLDKLSAELGEIGFDFKTGAEGFDENIQDGIHKFALSQVDMLNSMIKFVETIVAMEKLGDLDIKGDGIDFSDIFSKSFYDPGKGVTWNYTELYQEVAQTLLESGKDLEGITVAGYTLKQILEDAKNGIKDITIENDALVALLQALYSTSISQNYNPSDIYDSIVETFLTNGISGELSLGLSKIYVDAPSGIVLEFNDTTSHWLYNGKDLGEDPQDALKQALEMRAQELENFDVKTPEVINAGEQTVELTIHNTFVLSVSQVDAYAKDANVNFVEEPEKAGSISNLDGATNTVNITRIGSVNWDKDGSIGNKDLGAITRTDIVGALNELGIDTITKLVWATGAISVPTGFEGDAPLTANNILATLSALGINDIKTLSWQLGNTITGTFGTALPTTMQAVLQSLGITDVKEITPTWWFLNILARSKALELDTTLKGQAEGMDVDVKPEGIDTSKVENTVKENAGNITLPDAIATFASLIVGIAPVTNNEDGTTSGGMNTDAISDALAKYKQALGTANEEEALKTLFAALNIDMTATEGTPVGNLINYLKNPEVSPTNQQLICKFAALMLDWTGSEEQSDGTFSHNVKKSLALINLLNSCSTISNETLELLYKTLIVGKDRGFTTSNWSDFISLLGTELLGKIDEQTFDIIVSSLEILFGAKDEKGNNTGNATLTESTTANVLSAVKEAFTTAVNGAPYTITYNGDNTFTVDYQGKSFTFNPPENISSQGTVTKDNIEWTYKPDTDEEGNALNTGTVIVKDLEGQTWTFTVNSDNIYSNPKVTAKNITPEYTSDNKGTSEAVNDPNTEGLTWTFNVDGTFIGTGTFNGSNITITPSETTGSINVTADMNGKTVSFSIPVGTQYSGSGTFTDENTTYNLTYETSTNEKDETEVKITGMDGKVISFTIPESANLTGSGTVDTLLPEYDEKTTKVNEISGLPSTSSIGNIGQVNAEVTIKDITAKINNLADLNLINNDAVQDINGKDLIKFNFEGFEFDEDATLTEKLQQIILNALTDSNNPLDIKLLNFVLSLPTNKNGAYQVNIGEKGHITVLDAAGNDITADIAALLKQPTISSDWGTLKNNILTITNLLAEIDSKLSTPNTQKVNDLIKDYLNNPILLLTELLVDSTNNSMADWESLGEKTKELVTNFSIARPWTGANFWEDLLDINQNVWSLIDPTTKQFSQDYVTSIIQEITQARERGLTDLERIAYTRVAKQLNEANINFGANGKTATVETLNLIKLLNEIELETATLEQNFSSPYLNIINLINSIDPTQLINVTSLFNDLIKLFSEDLPDSKDITITAIDNATSPIDNIIAKLTELKNILSTISGNFSVTTSEVSQAKGNVALSKGTLMGELGPELYVTGGRYYIAGQSGAEFVNLPDDAIVFNHLQTKKLLGTGRAGRGNAVTSERAATSMATGNANGGPAKASASEALATLKSLRSMWKAIADASVQDLALLAGGGGGGGGNKELQNVTAEIQRWYNLLRQIDKLEKDITYQENLRNKIESDRIINGKAVYKTYREELSILEEEVARNKELSNLQKSWYDAKRAELAASDYGKIFTYNEEGLQLYVGDSTPGSGLGLDILEHLVQRDVNGQAIGAATNVKTLLDYLKSVGFNIDSLRYNNDGTVIDLSKLSGEDLDQGYVQMMQNFWDNLDGWRDELDGIYDSYRELLDKVLDNESKRNEILQVIVDNQLSVEKDVLQAIEDARQKEIDELRKQRDAFSESLEEFINGLTDLLDRERNMYLNLENANELNKLRRLLAILQRSGGSASQISSLLNLISTKEQDMYFDNQLLQIDAIKEASDKQIERLDTQINLMTETLEYEKAHGLLWDLVYEVMRKAPEEIQGFIVENTADWTEKSALQSQEDLRTLLSEILQWTEYRDDVLDIKDAVAGVDEHNWGTYEEAMKEFYKEVWTDDNVKKAKEAYDAAYAETADPNKADAAANAIFEAAMKALKPIAQAAATINNTSNSTSGIDDNNYNPPSTDTGLKKSPLAGLKIISNHPEIIYGQRESLLNSGFLLSELNRNPIENFINSNIKMPSPTNTQEKTMINTTNINIGTVNDSTPLVLHLNKLIKTKAISTTR